jgi:cell fate (sporulation/competence/biofilm development) regulator YmcA (YheA/YmcA/DUF963 family)
MSEKVNLLFRKVFSLPLEIQENLAFFWSQEIENEIDFDATISKTSDKLTILAKEALNEYKSDKTEEIGMDEL